MTLNEVSPFFLRARQPSQGTSSPNSTSTAGPTEAVDIMRRAAPASAQRADNAALSNDGYSFSDRLLMTLDQDYTLVQDYKGLRPARFARSWHEGIVSGTTVKTPEDQQGRMVTLGPKTDIYDTSSSTCSSGLRSGSGAGAGEGNSAADRVDQLVSRLTELNISATELVRPDKARGVDSWVILLRRRLPGTDDAIAVAAIFAVGPTRVSITTSAGLYTAEWLASLFRRTLLVWSALAIIPLLVYCFQEFKYVSGILYIQPVAVIMAGIILPVALPLLVLRWAVNTINKQSSVERRLADAQALFDILGTSIGEVF